MDEVVAVVDRDDELAQETFAVEEDIDTGAGGRVVAVPAVLVRKERDFGGFRGSGELAIAALVGTEGFDGVFEGGLSARR